MNNRLCLCRAVPLLSVGLPLLLTLSAVAQPLPGPLERGKALPPPTSVPGTVMFEEAPPPPILLAPPPPILLAPPPAPLEVQMRRAGYPRSLSCLAKPSDNGQYVGYYVGGGCPFWKCAQPRTPEEGTWGWDYSGCCIQRCVMLGWWHGKPQGGRGAYRVDGPSLIHHIQEKKALNEGH